MLKNFLFNFYLHCGYVQLRDYLRCRKGRAHAVVLCYHRIGAADVLTKSPEDFKAELQYLKRHFECISLAELCRRFEKNEAFRQPAAVVTFDDGYQDNYSAALPILQSEDVTATFFVATGFMGTDREFPHDIELAAASRTVPTTYPKLSWDELRAMQAAGFEIGSHTVEHTDMGSAEEATITKELIGSINALTNELGEKPRAFAFPWGKPQNISSFALKGIREAGYYAAVCAYGGDNAPSASPFHIRRVDAGNGNLSFLTFRARLAGFDPDFIRLKWSKRLSITESK